MKVEGSTPSGTTIFLLADISLLQWLVGSWNHPYHRCWDEGSNGSHDTMRLLAFSLSFSLYASCKLFLVYFASSSLCSSYSDLGSYARFEGKFTDQKASNKAISIQSDKCDMNERRNVSRWQNDDFQSVATRIWAGEEKKSKGARRSTLPILCLVNWPSKVPFLL